MPSETTEPSFTTTQLPFEQACACAFFQASYSVCSMLLVTVAEVAPCQLPDTPLLPPVELPPVLVTPALPPDAPPAPAPLPVLPPCVVVVAPPCALPAVELCPPEFALPPALLLPAPPVEPPGGVALELLQAIS